MIDGGKGHLSSAERIIHELGISGKVDLACIAKGKFRNNVETDEVLLPGKKSHILSKNSPFGFYYNVLETNLIGLQYLSQKTS